jgi:hypothetical protein
MRRINSAAMAKKWDTVLPADVCLINQSQVGLVNQRGRLQGVARTLATHVVVGQPVQFVMDQWDEFVIGGSIAIAPVLKQSGDFLRQGGRHG